MDIEIDVSRQNTITPITAHTSYEIVESKEEVKKDHAESDNCMLEKEADMSVGSDLDLSQISL